MKLAIESTELVQHSTYTFLCGCDNGEVQYAFSLSTSILLIKI